MAHNGLSEQARDTCAIGGEADIACNGSTSSFMAVVGA